MTHRRGEFEGTQAPRGEFEGPQAPPAPHLYDDVLGHVFSFLSLGELASVIVVVSRHWNNVVRTRTQSVHGIAAERPQCDMVLHWMCQGPLARHVGSLTFQSTRVLTGHDLIHPRDHMPNLRTLICTLVADRFPLRMPTSLTHLECHHLMFDRAQVSDLSMTIQTLAAQLPLLCTLMLTTIHARGPPLRLKPLLALRHLRVLHVIWRHWSAAETFFYPRETIDALRTMPDLDTVKLTDLEYNLLSLFQPGHALQWKDHNLWLSQRVFEFFHALLPSLTRVRMSDVMHTQWLPMLPRLQTLELSRSRRIILAGLNIPLDLSACAKTLTELRITDVRMTSDGLQQMLVVLPRLKVLRLHDCDSVVSLAWTRMAPIVHTLRILELSGRGVYDTSEMLTPTHRASGSIFYFSPRT